MRCVCPRHTHSFAYENYNTVDKLEQLSFDKEEHVTCSEILINDIDNNLKQDQSEIENDADDNENATDKSCCFGWLCKTSKHKIKLIVSINILKRMK